MLQNLARRLLALMNWKLIDPPTRPPRAVLVAYPHTSNWDALHALLGKTALGLSAHGAGRRAGKPRFTASRCPLAYR